MYMHVQAGPSQQGNWVLVGRADYKVREREREKDREKVLL